jgi:hypothetical protein
MARLIIPAYAPAFSNPATKPHLANTSLGWTQVLDTLSGTGRQALDATKWASAERACAYGRGVLGTAGRHCIWEEMARVAPGCQQQVLQLAGSPWEGD